MRKKLNLLCFVLTINITSIIFAQSTWHFGNGGGLKISSTGSTSLATGSPINTGEGTAALVDRCNNVVMYTDGVKVWNGNHVQQNGTALFPLLTGHNSSTQTSVIVPIPVTSGTSTKAYIFTTNAAETGYGNGSGDAYRGLRVTLVNISGTAPSTTITVSSLSDHNQLLTPYGATMSEKLTVTEDGTGGYWVVTHGVNMYTGPNASGYIPLTGSGGVTTGGYNYSFIAYHVKSTTTAIFGSGSLNNTEQISAIPPTMSGGGFFNSIRSFDHPTGGSFGTLNATKQLNAQGQMKIVNISPTSAKIALTIPYLGISDNGMNYYSANPVAQIFDFNLTTGVVNNSTHIEFNLGFETNSALTIYPDGLAYGVEFSPSGRYLYVSSSLNCFLFDEPHRSRIYQYDLLASGGPSGITSSKQLIHTLPEYESFGALQIGPDNKIYIARNGKNYLDVINSPNLGGTACALNTSVPISGICNFGLPAPVLFTSPAGISANFSVATAEVGTSHVSYNISATPDVLTSWPTTSFWWEICEVDVATGLTVIGTPMTNAQTWWYAPFIANNNFPGYDYNLPPSSWPVTSPMPPGTSSYSTDGTLWGTNPAPGLFQVGHAYRITRATWGECIPWTTVSKYVYVSAPVIPPAGGKTPINSAEVIIMDLAYSPPMPEELNVQTSTLSINSLDENEIIISPNPSNGIFSISTYSELKKDIYVYDVTGKIVYQNLSVVEKNITLNLSEEQKGIYIVRITDANSSTTHKIIIE